METSAQSDSICCPKFNPEPWEVILHQWENKPFIKDKVVTFFYMPLNFGGVMRRLDKLTRAAGATVPDSLCLSDHRSVFAMDLYLATDKPVDGAQNTTLSGKMFSKVYEGPFKDSGKWMADFRHTLAEKGYKENKIYSWYTTCPKCAKKYGRNYVVMLASTG